MNEVVWKPQPKQAEFMMRSEYEALYGGAAGGGKSDAMVAEALRQVHIPHYKAITFRKTFPQCRELILKSHRIYKKAFPDAKYNGSEHCWTFPSGARIYFGSLPDYIQGAVIRNADRISDEEELHRFSDTVRRELK